MSNQPMNKDKQPQTVYVVNGGEKLEENFATVCPVSELECIESVYIFTQSELSSFIAEKQREAAEKAWSAAELRNDYKQRTAWYDQENLSIPKTIDQYINTNYPINK